MRHIISFILLLCLTQVSAQNDQLLTPEQQKADADYYFKTLYEKHPNPYHYYPLNEFEDKKNKIYSQLNEPLTHEQFTWIIGEMNSCLDMHSLIHIYYQTHWRKKINNSVTLFPAIKIKDDKIYIKNSNAEIIEINGIKTNEIIQDFKKYFNWKLPYERNIYSMEAFFSSLLIYKYNLEAPFKVKFNNTSAIQTLEGSTLDEYNKESSIGLRGGAMSFFKIYPYSSIAIFNMTNFQDGERTALEDELKIFFKGVNNMHIQNVFYDLSMNSGGTIKTLYSAIKSLNIIKHDNVTFRVNKTERSNQINKRYKSNEIVLQSNMADSTIPKERKLYVIQGINTASGGDYFCRIVAENKLGTLVGQNTGEPTVAFSSSPFHTMPNSKIQFSVATTLWDYSDYFKEETLHPDVYWDVNHTREFSEQELIDIIEHCKKQNDVQIK